MKKNEKIGKVRQQIAEAKEALNKKPSGKKVSAERIEEIKKNIREFDPFEYDVDQFFKRKKKAKKNAKKSSVARNETIKELKEHFLKHVNKDAYGKSLKALSNKEKVKRYMRRFKNMPKSKKRKRSTYLNWLQNPEL